MTPRFGSAVSEPTFLNLDGTGWTAVTALATVLLVVTALVAAWIAVVQLRSAKQTWREERRAYLVADFESSPASLHIIDFVVRNIGRTAATDVRIEWDQAPIPGRNTYGEPFADARIFHEPVPMVAPGREYRLLFENFVERHNKPDLIDRFTVTLRYTDRWHVEHVEHFPLDLGVLKGSRFVMVKTVHDLAKSVEQITAILKNAQAFQSRPVQVVTETREQQAQREQAQWDELRDADGRDAG
jgi:hypothetical protein